MRAENVSFVAVGSWLQERDREDLSGLSARKRRTILPFGRAINVSLRIGTVGSVSFAT